MNNDVKVKDLKRTYDANFVPSQAYLDSMPDLQNADFVGIPIDFVGIQGMHLPLKVREKDGGVQEVMVNVTGTVSLDAHNRGVNLSRILRTLYKSKDDIFDINKVEEVLRNYQKDIKTFDSHILMNFKYRIWQDALRSVKDDGTPEGGWQYYDVTFDCNLDVTGEFKKIMHVIYLYASSCPCSTALSEHAALTRGVYGIPHSQRSVAKLSLEFDNLIWIEDVVRMCNEALTTEVLVFCKREDEQAFAEKNGAQPKFVEDAIRYIADVLNKNDDVTDYKVVCSHLESLHAHQAVAVITKGKTNSIFNHHVSHEEWISLSQN